MTFNEFKKVAYTHMYIAAQNKLKTDMYIHAQNKLKTDQDVVCSGMYTASFVSKK